MNYGLKEKLIEYHDILEQQEESQEQESPPSSLRKGMSVMSQTSKSFEKPLILELLRSNDFSPTELIELRNVLSAIALKNS